MSLLVASGGAVRPAVAQDASVPPTEATAAEERQVSLASSGLKGTIESADGETRLEEGRVFVIRVATGEVAGESPVGRGGGFSIESLIQGYYRLFVDVAGARYVSNRLLLIPPKKVAKAEFRLGPVTAEDRELGIEPGMTPPGTDVPIDGVARLTEKMGPSGFDWFKSGTGYAVLLGGGAALVALLVASSDSGSNGSFDSSPSSP